MGLDSISKQILEAKNIHIGKRHAKPLKICDGWMESNNLERSECIDEMLLMVIENEKWLE